MDIRSAEAVTTLLEEVQPNVVIHAAAERRIERCELDPVLADETNAVGTENVCAAAKRVGAWVLLISTDCGMCSLFFRC